jgi:hypothetical protein
MNVKTIIAEIPPATAPLVAQARLPWWLVVFQLSPLILQIAGEIILRIQGIQPPSVAVVQSTDSAPVLPIPNGDGR